MRASPFGEGYMERGNAPKQIGSGVSISPVYPYAGNRETAGAADTEHGWNGKGRYDRELSSGLGRKPA